MQHEASERKMILFVDLLGISCPLMWLGEMDGSKGSSAIGSATAGHKVELNRYTLIDPVPGIADVAKVG